MVRFALVFALVPALAVASVVGPAFPVEVPALQASPGVEQDTAVASDGTDYFVVWADGRNGSVPTGLYGARVTAAGVVRDPQGLLLSSWGEGESEPAIAFDGTNYLVVWTRASAASGPTVMARRVTRAGVLLESAPTALAPGQSPSVTFTGNSFFAVWQSGTGVRGVRLSSAGLVVDTTPIVFPTGSLPASQPVIASDGSNVLVVWRSTQSGATTDEAIRGQRVASSGALLGSTIEVTSLLFGRGNPAIVFGGGRYLVLWEDNPAPNYFRVSGARVDTAGSVEATFSMDGAVDQHSPAVAWDGSQFFITWADTRGTVTTADVRFARIPSLSQIGMPVVGTVGGGTGDERFVAAASNGANMLVAWTDLRNGNPDIFASRVGKASGSADPAGILVSQAPRRQFDAAVAWNGTHFLAAWADRRSGTGQPGAEDIYAARVDAQGTVIDTTPLAVTATSGAQDQPAVASDGAQYLVAWRTGMVGNRNIHAARVSASGQVLDLAGLLVTNAAGEQSSPQVAWDGTSFVVVWKDERPGAVGVYANRVSPLGVVLDGTGVLVSTATADAAVARIAATPAQTLVLFQDTGALVARRLDASLTVVDATPIVLAPASAAPSGADVTADGATYLAVWADERLSSQADIRGARVAVAGGLLDASGFSIAARSGTQSAPRVAFDGTYFQVLFGEAAVGHLAARVRPDGTVVDLPTALLATPVPTTPALAAGPARTVLLAYAAPGLGEVHRIFGRVMGSERLVGLDCTQAPECQSGFCADGVCCGDACAGGLSDCQACNVDAGASLNGTCGTIAQGTWTCRAASRDCDQAEQCDGVVPSCPSDGPLPAGSVCGPMVSGTCDVADVCRGFVCEERVADAGVECRAARGTCDVSEVCDGALGSCPGDLYAANGTVCDDSLACSTASACTAGSCLPTMSLGCDDGNPCTTDLCGEPMGCRHLPLVNCSGTGGGSGGGAGGGAAVDAGTGGGTTQPNGCGCQSGEATAMLGAALTLLLGARRRRAGLGA